jgi:hypothetical protein
MQRVKTHRTGRDRDRERDRDRDRERGRIHRVLPTSKQKSARDGHQQDAPNAVTAVEVGLDRLLKVLEQFNARTRKAEKMRLSFGLRCLLVVGNDVRYVALEAGSQFLLLDLTADYTCRVDPLRSYVFEGRPVAPSVFVPLMTWRSDRICVVPAFMRAEKFRDRDEADHLGPAASAHNSEMERRLARVATSLGAPAAGFGKNRPVAIDDDDDFDGGQKPSWPSERRVPEGERRVHFSAKLCRPAREGGRPGVAAGIGGRRASVDFIPQERPRGTPTHSQRLQVFFLLCRRGRARRRSPSR